jgi:hypothetical protein
MRRVMATRRTSHKAKPGAPSSRGSRSGHTVIALREGCDDRVGVSDYYAIMCRGGRASPTTSQRLPTRYSAHNTLARRTCCDTRQLSNLLLRIVLLSHDWEMLTARRFCRALSAGGLVAFALSGAAVAQAQPAPPPPPPPEPLAAEQPAQAEPPPPPAEPNPWPDIRYYDVLDANQFALPGGVWFVSPTGQNCGIWGRGNFGCTGAIPGAPANVRHIGWINGDRAVHYDWSMAVRFPATQAQRTISPRGLIRHEGTTCAVTPDSRTYCERGPMRFVIEPTKTWLSAAWTDQSWRVLGPTTTAPQ